MPFQYEYVFPLKRFGRHHDRFIFITGIPIHLKSIFLFYVYGTLPLSYFERTNKEASQTPVIFQFLFWEIISHVLMDS